MSLSQSFSQSFYEGSAYESLLSSLNRMAALVPVVETDIVSPSAVRSAALDAAGIGGHEAFSALVENVSAMTNLDGNKNVCAKPDIQNKLFKAFEGFNTAIVNDPSISLTEAGAKHFADCKRSRDVYVGMSHSGLGATTYQVNWPAIKIA